MLRILAWTLWIIILIVIGNLTIVMIPFRLTSVTGEMEIDRLTTSGKTGATWISAEGRINGRSKPVRLSVSGLLKKTDQYGNMEGFKAQYVNTGIPLDVVVGTMWFSDYDVAYVNVKGRPQTPNMGIKLILLDVGLILILITLYAYLRHTRPPAPLETPYNNQPGGF